MEESFETYRSYLFSIAYRMLGSAMDAEDMVHETYIRYHAALPQTIHSLKAYLTTILTRLCMDQLHLARRKRELYVGPWLPEPILTIEMDEVGDPEKHVEMEEVNGQAALIIRTGDRVFSILTIEVEEGRIQAIRIITNPEKLARV
jgi:RNA polymerase sigma-70 factor (ECF subfamily)